jgi:uncharacterized protein YycO
MKYFCAFLLICIFNSVRIVAQQNYIPQTGDLFFQDVDCGSFCDAIEKVTTGFEGKNLSHVGIAFVESGQVFIFEAGGHGVVKTPLDSFLNKSFDSNKRPKVLVGRLKESYRNVIPAAISKCKSLIGKKYDSVFDLSNDQYYCSELVYYTYKDSTGRSLFEVAPMTFIDPDTHKTFPAWVDYFKKLGIPIPEGKPGLNPGGISRSDKLEIIFSYY